MTGAAPCGCPLTLFERTSGERRPITLRRVNAACGPAVWCAEHGWVDLTDTEYEEKKEEVRRSRDAGGCA